MGQFTYEGTVKADIEDRLLMHVQVVISDKLRRREAFLFTWSNDPRREGGRTTVWVNPAAAIAFTYRGTWSVALNRAWLEALAYTANSPGGLRLLREPAPAEVDAVPGSASRLTGS